MIANTHKQQLSHHLFAVGYLAQTLLRLVTNNQVDNKLLIATFNAGCLHDIGKLDPVFQKWVSKKKHDEIDLDEGQHVNETKFSFEKHPRHNEISLLLFNLLRNSSDKTINRANLDLIEHVIYWHHAKPIRDKDYEILNDVYKPLLKNLGEESFLQLQRDCYAIVQSVNQQAFDYTQNATLKLLNFCSSLNDDISLKIPLPAYKDYDENDDVHDYRENARLNANNAIARAVVITADRLISELSATELKQHITHRSLEKMAKSHLSQTDELKNHIQACLTDFEIRYPNSERNLQQSQAAEKLAQVHEIAVLKGAAGCGKTKIALEWALKTDVKKIIWICPRVQICQGLYNDLTADDYLPYAKIEIHTGEFKTISQNGIETETDENTAFSGDIVLTTIDQITNSILTHSHVTTLIEFMNSHVVFDEYHEYINMEAFNLLFAELLECKKVCASNANTLLVSATPNHFFLEEFLNIHVDDCINVTTFNNSRYQICFNEFDENSTTDANPLYAPQPKNSFVISNTATTAQLSFMQNEMRENALLLHSKFKKVDKQNLFEKVMQSFGQKGLKNYDVLRSAPVVQAALNITCDNMVSEITNAENTLQRLGRLDRFGQNETVNLLTIATPNTFQASKGCGRFLNSMHSFNSTKTWLDFLHKNLSNEPLMLAEIYQIYENFYRDESSKKAIEQDLLKALKASVQLINKKVIDPVSVPRKKVAKNSIVKIKKNSLRGDNRFVQMAVCEIENGKVVKFAEDYAYSEDSIDGSDNLTLSCQEILGYGDSNKNLLAFMAKKHHQVKKETVKKSYSDNALLNKARSPEFPIYVSYTINDLEKVASQNPDYAIYYATSSRQAIGIIKSKHLKF
jgi:CRISPR-associated endonuclease/helicase Cas3